jgi:hypothetical protein
LRPFFLGQYVPLICAGLLQIRFGVSVCSRHDINSPQLDLIQDSLSR